MGDEERLRRAWRGIELPNHVAPGPRRRSNGEASETGLCIKLSTPTGSRWTEEGWYGPEVRGTGWPSKKDGWRSTRNSGTK
jgi:hypothetical protein